MRHSQPGRGPSPVGGRDRRGVIPAAVRGLRLAGDVCLTDPSTAWPLVHFSEAMQNPERH